MNPDSTEIKLGKRTVALRFTSTAIITLDDRGINLYQARTFGDFSPSKMCTLIWAGQLGEEKPMTKDQIAALMPVKQDEYYDVAAKVAKAIRLALGIPEPEKKKNEEGESEGKEAT